MSLRSRGIFTIFYGKFVDDDKLAWPVDLKFGSPLSSEIKNTKSVNSFKHAIKDQYFDKAKQ